MKWPVFEKAYPQAHSVVREDVEYCLSESPKSMVDDIFARKSLRATMLLEGMEGSRFCFLWDILNETRLSACDVDIYGDDNDAYEAGGGDNYAEDIVSCAGAAFTRGELSLASLTAVYRLHESWVKGMILRENVADLLQRQPWPPPMLPGFPDMSPDAGDLIGVLQTRRVIDFLLRAWCEKWPLHAETRVVGVSAVGLPPRSISMN